MVYKEREVGLFCVHEGETVGILLLCIWLLTRYFEHTSLNDDDIRVLGC